MSTDFSMSTVCDDLYLYKHTREYSIFNNKSVKNIT